MSIIYASKINKVSHADNAASVVVVPYHVDITFFSPSGTPGVLHDPVFLVACATIAYCQYAMIQSSGGAGTGIVDTTSI
nr:unnamed protein product [Callosobruchus chinensis]